MKERPIVFSGPSVRAILDGQKTQMRRAIRRQPPSGCTTFTFEKFRYDDDEFRTGWYDNFDNYYRCPYGCPGDRLWVRETAYYQPADVDDLNPGGWRSPIFMTRAASRITLEITSVRVQRVQEISVEDICAEGLPPEAVGPFDLFAFHWDSINAKRGYPWADNPWVWAIAFRRVEAKASPERGR